MMRWFRSIAYWYSLADSLALALMLRLTERQLVTRLRQHEADTAELELEGLAARTTDHGLEGDVGFELGLEARAPCDGRFGVGHQRHIGRHCEDHWIKVRRQCQGASAADLEVEESAREP